MLEEIGTDREHAFQGYLRVLERPNNFLGMTLSFQLQSSANQPVIIWHGTARHGTARHGTARHGTARHGTARHGTARHGTARRIKQA